MPAVSQRVQPSPNSRRRLNTFGEFGDGGQDRPDVFGDVERGDRFRRESPGGDTEVLQGIW